MEKKGIKSSFGVYDKDELGTTVYLADLGKKRKYETQKCSDCDVDIDFPDDTEVGHILSCPGCGLEKEVEKIEGNKVHLKELTIEGEDWGE